VNWIEIIIASIVTGTILSWLKYMGIRYITMKLGYVIALITAAILTLYMAYYSIGASIVFVVLVAIFWFSTTAHRSIKILNDLSLVTEYSDRMSTLTINITNEILDANSSMDRSEILPAIAAYNLYLTLRQLHIYHVPVDKSKLIVKQIAQFTASNVSNDPECSNHILNMLPPTTRGVGGMVVSKDQYSKKMVSLLEGDSVVITDKVANMIRSADDELYSKKFAELIKKQP